MQWSMETSDRINLLTHKYKQFSDASGLPTKMERASVAGFRKVKTKSEIELSKSLTNFGENDKIMERMPYVKSASTPKEKFTKYLLNKESERGKDKAYVFSKVLGYSSGNRDELAEKIYIAVQKAPVIDIVRGYDGIKYITPLNITGRKGRNLLMDVVWQIDNNSTIPRLITITFRKK